MQQHTGRVTGYGSVVELVDPTWGSYTHANSHTRSTVNCTVESFNLLKKSVSGEELGNIYFSFFFFSSSFFMSYCVFRFCILYFYPVIEM